MSGAPPRLHPGQGLRQRGTSQEPALTGRGERRRSRWHARLAREAGMIGGQLRIPVTPGRPLLSVVRLLLLLAAAPVPAAEPIVIREIDSRTGQFPAQGSAVHQRVALASEEADAAAGIGGRRL